MRGFDIDASPRAGHLLPQPVQRLRQLRGRWAADGQDVGLCRGQSQPPAARQDVALDRGPGHPVPRRLCYKHVRVPDGEPTHRVAQTHRSAPSRQAHSTARKTPPRKTNISTIAVAPSRATTTDHGYMNSISTSNARKSSVARYHRTW